MKKIQTDNLTAWEKTAPVFCVCALCLFLTLAASSAQAADTDGQYSVIAGGKDNAIHADYAFIGNGSNNTINEDGDFSVIPNGKSVTINGSHSWAMGKNIKVTGSNVFFWGYKADGLPLTVTDSDVFIIYHEPKEGSISAARFGIQTTAPDYTMDVNGDAQAGTVIIDPVPDIAAGTAMYQDDNNQIGLDLTEIFSTTEMVEPGDVLVIAPSSSDTLLLKKSLHAYDKKVVGIVSTAPGMVFEGDRIVSDFSMTEATQKPPVALTGRVPCKVSLENGPIQIGDLLTTSSVPGHAMKADKNDQAIGTIVGKALEPFSENDDPEKNTGKIMVFVGLQ